jgi:uncharacterized membrane protein (DUF373 family)
MLLIYLVHIPPLIVQFKYLHLLLCYLDLFVCDAEIFLIYKELFNLGDFVPEVSKFLCPIWKVVFGVSLF